MISSYYLKAWKMKAEKKLSIKIKSKTERRIMDAPEAEMITEWNIKRIISAIIVFLIFIIIPAYYFSHSGDSDVGKNANSISTDESYVKKQDSIKVTIHDEIVPQPSSKETPPEVNVTQNSNKETLVEESIEPVPLVESSEQVDDEVNAEVVVAKTVKQQQASKPSPETKYLNPHITHAQLALGMNKLKPYGEVDLPLLVDNTEARGIFFFTEVSNMQGSTVFHEWLKEGKSIYKLKAIIRTNKSRFYTSKLFTHRSVGQWQVRIITDQGEVLHKIDFSVENR